MPSVSDRYCPAPMELHTSSMASVFLTAATFGTDRILGASLEHSIVPRVPDGCCGCRHGDVCACLSRTIGVGLGLALGVKISSRPPCFKRLCVLQEVRMLGRSTVLPCSSPSTNFAATSTLRQPRRPVLKSISAALVTDTPRPKAVESNGSRNGDGKVGEGGPTIINGQVRPGIFYALQLHPLEVYL